ncbi:protein halfway [Zerene cesonia]|uniref:protein halfway n=1 Tax=Zerene cesonia TaxID=33412 RepID=UPI0018E55A40|nr:protein halfway [Zerene cesonia]
MRNIRFCVDLVLWSAIAYLFVLPFSETRMEESMEPHPTSTEKPEEVSRDEPKIEKCFHMPRDKCPTDGQKCTRVDPVSVFCCDVDSFRLREALAIFMTQNTTNLHVSNATIKDLDVSQPIFRRLTSMALTDGNIGKIVGQFPKHSPIVCLNISNNNLSSITPQPPLSRPFAYLYALNVLDASSNNLTEFPLSLLQSNRKIHVDLSGNNYLPCKHFHKAMEVNSREPLLKFLHYNKTYCAIDLRYNWFKDVQIVQIDHVWVQKQLNESCQNIKPANINCTCTTVLELVVSKEATYVVGVDCSQRGLTEMPTNLPNNTVNLNVSYNNITSLQAISDDSTYDHLRWLVADYNDITSLVELEGSKFIDNFGLFSITNNKLHSIHPYVFSDRFDSTSATMLVAGNYIHCDCNTEKVLKPWLLENNKAIPDYKQLKCENIPNTAVFDLKEFQVCHTPRDWTDYIYYIIGLETLVLVLLVSKVSYDYWVFKTAGYLPWPANKMPRLPCDWLCE